jgi:hypothetical protein
MGMGYSTIGKISSMKNIHHSRSPLHHRIPRRILLTCHEGRGHPEDLSAVLYVVFNPFYYLVNRVWRSYNCLTVVLPAGVCGTTLSLKYASEVSVGDCINTLSGQEKVSMVQSVRGHGLYTIVTNEEYLVVNGIIVSPFGSNHLMANLYYNIHRFAYMASPFLLTWPYLHATNEVSKCSVLKMNSLI